MIKKLIAPLTAIVVIAASSVSFQANATPAFAGKEKKACVYCHLQPNGGENWGFRGIYYDKHKYSFKGFSELKEAKKAGVKPKSVGKAAKPTKPYKG